jgi:uncharacterized membrane protein
MFHLLLFLHILGAIAAFGFGFIAPVLGSMLAKEPQHGGWYIRAVKRVSDVVLVPAALSMAVTGVGLVMVGAHRFEEPWLVLSLVIYVGALAAVFLVQRPTLDRLIVLTSSPPGPDGPSPEVPVLSRRIARIGIGLTVAVIAILVLMVWKPPIL